MKLRELINQALNAGMNLDDEVLLYDGEELYPSMLALDKNARKMYVCKDPKA